MNVTFALDENFSSSDNLTQGFQTSICDGSFNWYVHGPLIAFCALIIAFNSVVIALMCWKESLRTPSNTILISLAVSDLMSGLVGIPLIFTCSVTMAVATMAVVPCVSSALFMRFTAVSSVLHFVLVACDRYAMITHAMRYHTLVTKLRVGFALIAVWFISPTVSAVQMAWYDINENLAEKKHEDEVYLLVFIVAFFALPLLLMLFIYSHILAVSLRHVFASRARRANLGDESASSIAHNLRGTVILLSMLAVFIGCWMPFYLLILQDHINVQIIPFRPWEMCLFLFLRFVPPMSNPIFCAFCKRDFRSALRLWIRTRRVSVARWFGHSKSTPKRSHLHRAKFTVQSLDVLSTANDRNGTTSTIVTSLRLSPSPSTFRADAVNR